MKKEGENHYYNKYKTKRGGKGTNLDLINKEEIKFGCYIIEGKTMRHFARNECTLGTIRLRNTIVKELCSTSCLPPQ